MCAILGLPGGCSLGGGMGGSQKAAPTNKGPEDADSPRETVERSARAKRRATRQSNISTRQLTGVLSCACLFLVSLAAWSPASGESLQAASSHRVPLCLVFVYSLGAFDVQPGRAGSFPNPPGPELRISGPSFVPK